MKLKHGIIILSASLAVPYAVADLMVTDGWVRESIPGQSVTAGYLQLSNSGPQDCQLQSVKSDATARVEIHEHRHSDGKMQMRQVDVLTVPAQGKVSFEPGGYHLMLFDLAQPLKQNASVEFTFSGGDCGDVTVTMPVKGLE